jgi:hypothetical protein
VLLEAGGLSVRSDGVIVLPLDRRTTIPVRLVNRTAASARVVLDGSDPGVGVHPFRVEVAAGATVEAPLDVTPLRAGELDVEWRLASGGVERRFRQRLRVVVTGRLLVRVSDAAGRAVPALVRITAADGRSYAPDGLSGGEFESDGLFEVAVPAGDVEVSVAPAAARPSTTASAGPPARRSARVSVDPDRTVRLEVALP